MVPGERPMKHATAESESLWQAFFANPFEWWDNRSNKVEFHAYCGYMVFVEFCLNTEKFVGM